MAQELAASQDRALSQNELRQVLSQALNQENDPEFSQAPSQEPSEELSQEARQDQSQDQSQEQSQKADENAAEQLDASANEDSGGESQGQNQEASHAANEPAPDAIGEQALDAAEPAKEQLLAPAFLDRIPLGILVYRHDGLLYANRHFLDLSGYGDVAAPNPAPVPHLAMVRARPRQSSPTPASGCRSKGGW